ncbi:MAG: M67 family metallopeptidase [Acidobacteria bacterium]|nr:M67 family metallopeptidase [Acidobacteriota bacterium]
MITVPETLRTAIAAHARDDYPDECCGLLLGTFSGDDRTVMAVEPLGNAREDAARHHRFLIGPDEMRRADSDARARGLDIVGIYHSHPDCPAVPSQYDIDHAWPTYSYVIVAVSDVAITDMQSWRLRDDRTTFDAEPIE